MSGADRPPDPAATARMLARVARVVRSDRPSAAGRTLRDVRDADAVGLVALVGAAYDEFDCGPLDPGGFDADLTAPASFARTRGRRRWVVTDEDDVPLASVAHSEPRHDATSRAAVVELHRLYLAPTVRGQGLATALVAGVADEARRLGGQRLIAWSDTRLVAAHARYLALGFTLDGDTRELHDPAGTTELRFDLLLSPGGAA